MADSVDAIEREVRRREGGNFQGGRASGIKRG
jgi:hypothetical protein